MYDPAYIPKTFAPVPGAPIDSTFKSVLFIRAYNSAGRSSFWVSNRYLRYDDDRFYMPASMIAGLNKGYRGTGKVTVTKGI